MSVIVADIENGRNLIIEEVAGTPGSIFLTTRDARTGRDTKPGTYEFDKATLLEALREAFGLVDPFELALTGAA
jgi:hypothetical protein